MLSRPLSAEATACRVGAPIERRPGHSARAFRSHPGAIPVGMLLGHQSDQGSCARPVLWTPSKKSARGGDPETSSHHHLLPCAE